MWVFYLASCEACFRWGTGSSSSRSSWRIARRRAGDPAIYMFDAERAMTEAEEKGALRYRSNPRAKVKAVANSDVAVTADVKQAG